ncbi:MAG: hypothetical protein V4578_18370 [Pseudomonadota bacterium]
MKFLLMKANDAANPHCISQYETHFSPSEKIVGIHGLAALEEAYRPTSR